jgi:hypothetical protein
MHLVAVPSRYAQRSRFRWELLFFWVAYVVWLLDASLGVAKLI